MLAMLDCNTTQIVFNSGTLLSEKYREWIMQPKTAREAPIRFQPRDPARPQVIGEPVLNTANIQGNILAGFNKDFQTLVFLRVTNVEHFRLWLGRLIPFIATTSEVLRFNRLFKEIRSRRRVETGTVQSTWMNVALSFHALSALSGDGTTFEHSARENFPEFAEFAQAKFLTADAFEDEAFKQGMQARSIDVLSDPPDPGVGKLPAEGNRNSWLFGGPKNEPDVVVILASDTRADLSEEVARLEDAIFAGRSPSGEFAPSGVEIIYKQHGATLPPPLTGHEHFGFLDGVSQPGVRGRVSSTDPSDLLTLRQNPDDLNQGKPGQDLIWPGEFVFGYPGQDPKLSVEESGPDSLTLKPWKDGVRANEPPKQGPVWAKDGAFYVVRRLRQDVAGFHSFLEQVGKSLGVGAGLVGAKIVGRWASGAPILRAASQDDPLLANDDCANNHFEFQDASAPIAPRSPQGSLCSDTRLPQSAGDKTGAVCPFAAHIRKTYPRDDTGTLSPAIGEQSTQTHRLLRRGIPFGVPLISGANPDGVDSGDRGLVFAAYQTSITEGFEFVQASWANNPDFKDKSVSGTIASGHDLVIGQTNSGLGKGSEGGRERRAVLTLQIGEQSKSHEIVAPVDWVIPTGGGYFFAPSIDALCLLTNTLDARILAKEQQHSRNEER
jgi:Dyp-type peroxidase family